jgi:hypothetical protein
VLALEKLEMLVNACPEKEEVEQFLNYHPENIDIVAAPDLFFMDVCVVP